MNDAALRNMPAAPTPSPEECLWRGTRQRLQAVANQCVVGAAIYINGERFSREHFQFLIDNFHCPKPK